MAKLIQFCTQASLYDGPFGGKVGWPAAGMGYVVVTDHNRLIVIDGGHEQDAADLLALLRRESGKPIPEVALWIITHPHGDHMGALKAIARHKEIRIDTIIYDFSPLLDPAVQRASLSMQEICDELNATPLQPAPDQCLCIDGTELHFLYTPAVDALPDSANANHLSLIFTVQGAHRKVMLTADAYFPSMQATVQRYGSALKSDILQLPHHGLCDTGHPEFYALVNAQTVLIPISKSGYRAMHDGTYPNNPGTAWNADAEQNALVVHKAFEGTVTLEI